MPTENNLMPVGKYEQRFNTLTGQNLPCAVIYQSAGLAVHVQKRHPEEVGNMDYIPQIIQRPDYVGKHPQEQDSIELVKRLDKNVMVCVKLDRKEGYLFVASVFSISEAKLQNRLNSGRLKKY